MNLYLTTNRADYKVECSQVKTALVITEKLNFAYLATGKIQTGFFFITRSVLLVILAIMELLVLK